MVIQHNASYATAYRHYQTNTALMMKAALRIASGKKILSAADDPAGLAISQKMKAQLRGLEAARKNSIDAQGFLRVAEGTMQTVHDILQRMNELAVRAANGTNSDHDRSLLDIEFQALLDELDETVHGTTFNGMRVFGSKYSQKLSAQDSLSVQESGAGAFGAIDGSSKLSVKVSEIVNGGKALDPGSILAFDGEAAELGEIQISTGSFGGFIIQVGSNAGDEVMIQLNMIDAKALGIGGLSIATQKGAQVALSAVGGAIKNVSIGRAQIGAAMNTLDYRISNLEIYAENIAEAESRISDADIAKEMVNYTKYKLLADVGAAIMLHEQQRQESVLMLLNFDYQR